RSRPTVNGITMPGKSTTLRTGTMISASSGSGRDVASRPGCPVIAEPSTRVPASAVTGSALGRVSSFMVSLADLAQPQYQAAVQKLARTRLESRFRQRDAPFEVAVGNLELPHRAARAGKRQRALRPHHQRAGLPRHLDPLGRDARQSDDDDDFVLVLENVHRRLS